MDHICVIIGIETILFHQTTCFRYQGIQYKSRYFILHNNHCNLKFQMAAVKSLNNMVIINLDRADIISAYLMLSI